MSLPELNTEQKLAVRNWQINRITLAEQHRALTERIRQEDARGRALIEGFASGLGLELDKVSFDLDTLIFDELAQVAEGTPAAQAADSATSNQ